jgi:murein DD-endopeptidase MepM/ murein hydrolase activator NlpD
MASRRWTVVLVPENGTTVRQIRVSGEVARLLLGLVLFLVAGGSSLGAVLLAGGGGARADDRLLARNQLLERELERMALRLDTLEGSLVHLAGKDQFYRLLAGLEPNDPDVLLAGIGGPDADSLEAGELYPVDERMAARAFTTSAQVSSLLRRATVLASSWSEAEGVLKVSNARLAATPSIAPTRGYVSSSFSSSRFHPILERARPHMGLDIVAPVGEPVVATAAGRVVGASRSGPYGLLVEIDHGHGLTTRYAHLSRMHVKAGQAVKRGDTIGAVGTSGLSAGPHLHYEVLVHGRHANPTRYILDADVLPD